MTLLRWLAALPPTLVTIGLVVVVAGEMADVHLLTLGRPRTLPEAAAAGDRATAARLVEDGSRPDDIGMLRRGWIGDRVVLATALESAVLSRDIAMFEFLTSHSNVGDASREQLACLAQDVGAPDALRRLAADAVLACEPGRALETVVNRP